MGKEGVSLSSFHLTGSEFCVSSETFPGELCEKNRDRLDLWTGSETKWNVEPANITSGMCFVCGCNSLQFIVFLKLLKMIMFQLPPSLIQK